MLKTRLHLAICLTLLLGAAHAQHDLSSLLLQDSWQAMNANPALQPKGLVVNLPGVYNNLWVTNITFNDLIVNDNGATLVDVANAIPLLEASNTLREDLDIETIGVGFNIGRLGLSLGHRMRFNALLDYPKTLAQLIWQGNAQFVGQTVGFGPSLELTAYHEVALGASFSISDKVRIGGRAKLLSGSNNLQTERSNLQLTTSDDIYQLDLDADLRVNSAGSLTYDGLRDVDVDFNFGNFSGTSLFGAQSGVAFDLGVVIDLGKLQLTASALDLGGSIEWKENVKNYTLSGNYVFEGLDLARPLLNDDGELGSILDSLYATYEPTETSQAYTTQIGQKFYLSGQYELSEKIQVGVAAFADNYRDANTAALALTGSMQLSPLLRVGALWGLRNERWDNIGANATIALGPVRLLLATDNIITAFRPRDAHVVNFRLGANLVFGASDGINGQ